MPTNTSQKATSGAVMAMPATAMKYEMAMATRMGWGRSPVKRRIQIGPSPVPMPVSAKSRPRLMPPPSPMTKMRSPMITWMTWKPPLKKSELMAF